MKGLTQRPFNKYKPPSISMFGSLEKFTLAPDNSELCVCLKLVMNEGQLYK